MVTFPARVKFLKWLSEAKKKFKYKNGPDCDFCDIYKNLLVAHDVEKLAPADIFHNHVKPFGHAGSKIFKKPNHVFVIQINQQF